ncbi:hypothetical protein [Methanohalophilus halophilus]|uniref:Uncharacterized protein n=1 Tax=Methanohalophilus halophilus TaxID=2177 RepID=A0A1H2WRF0_9EURY|nr:hypothetical protein [Methanohalophilus halophilus]SDW83210.1 hypothetical protein SAMN04515625_1693 [Methanohalophilus halophilus]
MLIIRKNGNTKRGNGRLKSEIEHIKEPYLEKIEEIKKKYDIEE